MPDWIEQNAGTVLTVGGSVVVAIITVIGAVWAKYHTPRQPVPIQDVWGENRTLRGELEKARVVNDDLSDDLRRLRDGLSALWRYVSRIGDAWGVQDAMPALTPDERRALVAAEVLDDRDSPGASVPAGR